MVIKPDDQVLDYFIYIGKRERFLKEVERFITGYAFWAHKIRRTLW